MHSNNKLFNIRIALYGFILTVAVIWIHAVEPAFTAGSVYTSDNSVFEIAEELLGNVLGQLAVPGFFCMSGYLFFRSFNKEAGKNGDIASVAASGSAEGNISRISAVPGNVNGDAAETGCSSASEVALLFRRKLTKRAYSLALPYVLWNLIYYIIYLAAGRASLSVPELVNAVVDYGYNPVFWYLHELILITVITPLIYVLLKSKVAVLPVLAAIYASAVFYDFLPFHYVNEDALLYYCTGAAMSLHLKGYEDKPDYIGRAGAACFLIFVICTELTHKLSVHGYMAVLIGGRLSGMLMLLATACVSVRREMKLPSFTGYNFFIYAVHYLEIRLLQAFFDAMSRCVFGTPLFENDVLSTTVYICMPFMCIALAVLLGNMLRKLTPGLYAVLTGGRS